MSDGAILSRTLKGSRSIPFQHFMVTKVSVRPEPEFGVQRLYRSLTRIDEETTADHEVVPLC